ncbi:CLUMA_CG013371, isoform A [Clunio marinus]|uniref:CLUMA_CG013371, isoform A n=1 Tax=Clunio marinus TaxID=568069 RepID=A0A1J1INN0_9DIPT|nr:CLUMA_CG013371, isoform A [Clunio marinus]
MEYQNSPLNLIKKEDKKTNRRSSFFNVNPSEEEKKEADRQYLKSLLAERADWIEIIRSNQKKIKKAKSKELPVYDSSILDEEKKKFLEGAIDVQQYVKDLIKILGRIFKCTSRNEPCTDIVTSTSNVPSSIPPSPMPYQQISPAHYVLPQYQPFPVYYPQLIPYAVPSFPYEIGINPEKPVLNCIYFEYHDQGAETESIEGNDDEQVAASTHWMLPNIDETFIDLWESLIYDGNLKEELLDFAQTILLFSQKNINQNIVSCNRLILLHGPPGTGKTSLAKALAQKLSIRMKPTFPFTHLFEINSHSLFSKWFSESGKLVQKMFQQIQEIVETNSSLVCVLIDEVESIAYARGNISNNEPSDSVRVVNAFLTQLDRIKKYPNVLVITTSNLTSSIDHAFLDRADIVTHIVEPSLEAIYKIISSSIIELSEKELINNLKIDERENELKETFQDLQSSLPSATAELMIELSKDSIGLSGRTLRKLPFLAHAIFLKNKNSSTLIEFIIALRSAVNYIKNSKKSLGKSYNQIINE